MLSLNMTKRFSNIFVKEVNRLTDADSHSMSCLRGNNLSWAKKYIPRTLFGVIEIDDQQDEIELLLSKIDHQPAGFLIKILPVEELLMNLKFYYIAWGTLKDLVARFVSIVLDLGIADIDLNFGVLLRNEKVKNTRIPEICSKYSSYLNVGETDKARNEAVHRGKLLDEEVLEIKRKKTTYESQRLSLLKQENECISEEEYKQKKSEFYDELKTLVDRKREEYKKHYETTMELNAEIAIELATVWHQYMKDVKL